MFTNNFLSIWFRAKFQTIKFRAHRKSSIRRYARRFSRMADAELTSIVVRERSCRGWTSERSYYLHALRRECARRRLPYIS